MESPSNSNLRISAAAKACGLLITLMILAVSNFANAVVIDGREWLQPADVYNFSYTEIANICDIRSGICKGALSLDNDTSVDLTGWIWASATDVARLFEYLTEEPRGSFGEVTTFSVAARSPWVQAAIDASTAGCATDTGLFKVTIIAPGNDFGVHGLTRSLTQNGEANRAYIRDHPKNSQAIIGNPVKLDAARSWVGVWLYRNVPLQDADKLTPLE